MWVACHGLNVRLCPVGEQGLPTVTEVVYGSSGAVLTRGSILEGCN